MHNDEHICTVLEQVGEFISLDSVMVVGAACRDIHQSSFRNAEPARATGDVDLGLAVEDWGAFLALRSAFSPHSSAWQEVKIGDIAVDLVPFGPLETPPGTVVTDDGIQMNVAGFQEAFDNADLHTLSNGMQIKIPTVPGLAALKLHAWLDRYLKGNYKDAYDLALIMAWYGEPQAERLFDRFLEYREPEEIFPDDQLAAFVLGADVAVELGVEAASILHERFEREPENGIELLAKELTCRGEHSLPKDRRRAQVDSLLDGLNEGIRGMSI
ncbi:nucleotidyl transferase AbiEii/AbiGii toxin family protein [Corynebacterium genitalium ATCC 33030]|uniref:Nucleotidyltransferase n=1 Tax=Corynebacterium genitalium ATCC 33030 TaxID=585529 RepID=D7WBH4_9CORY|nr:nucleotidyl transferase AbiEii/AbiGii toxin family protein [Corynebacterium genitalium]EFK55205.1 hypothetical protein HMPREF0291_10463 [Corynebacterium genitalium ATCC 33030]UUA89533.1 nucleotidyl transferase AbiEii/AbiGii toxin family protein [Corynebacterium genitalium ATCC 33030]